MHPKGLAERSKASVDVLLLSIVDDAIALRTTANKSKR